MSEAADTLTGPAPPRPLRFRHLAPAGAPLRAIDLVRWAGAALRPGDPRVRLHATIAARFGVSSRAVSTGRAGMTLLLSALAKLAGGRRTEVVLPSYTCYSVAASVMKAGLTPHLVDIDPATLDFDLDALERAMHDGVLAIVATNLYGYPSDGRIGVIAGRHGAFFVDDAAQSMGATRDGAAVGTRGDAGLFSLDKGKNVSAIDGGVIVSRHSGVTAAIDAAVAALPPPRSRHVATDAVKAVAYFALLRPWLYWIPASLPGLQLGATAFRMDFPIEGYSRTLAALAEQAVARLDAFTAARRATAGRLVAGLGSAPGLRTLPPIAGAEPVFLRLPVFADTAERRAGWLRRLNEAAVGATGSYPACLADVPEVRACAVGASGPLTGGRHVAARIMTLPTHPLVSAADVARIVDLLGGRA